jgi:hypothetical protein
MRIANNKHVLAFMLVIFLLVFITGCGGKAENYSECTEAPIGSIVTISPSSQVIKVAPFLMFDTHMKWQVNVNYPDDKGPIPGACLNITGLFAKPDSYQLYEFETYPTYLPLPNGFKAATNSYGVFTFSTLLSAGTSTFNDTIIATSGGNVPATAAIAIEN